jgi:L-lactate dehydrogenase complex protein LldG
MYTDPETMSKDLVTTFLSSIENVDAETSCISSDELGETIKDVTVGYTVAAEFPFNTDGIGEDVVVDPTTVEIERAQTGVTVGTLGIASYGTVVVMPTRRKEGPVSLYPQRHIAVVRTEDIVADVETAFDRLENEFEQDRDDAIFVTGPSSTGDMGELVRGVHGPAEMHVIIIDE